MQREITVRGIDFTVEYQYYPGCRGARERGTGIQLEPDEGPSIEIESVKSDDDLMEVLDSKGGWLDEIEEKLIEIEREPHFEED